MVISISNKKKIIPYSHNIMFTMQLYLKLIQLCSKLKSSRKEKLFQNIMDIQEYNYILVIN